MSSCVLPFLSSFSLPSDIRKTVVYARAGEDEDVLASVRGQLAGCVVVDFSDIKSEQTCKKVLTDFSDDGGSPFQSHPFAAFVWRSSLFACPLSCPLPSSPLRLSLFLCIFSQRALVRLSSW